jgi:hypothetical protein
VRKADSAVSGIDMLASCPAGTEGIEPALGIKIIVIARELNHKLGLNYREIFSYRFLRPSIRGLAGRRSPKL